MQPSTCGKETASVLGLCALDNPIHTIWMARSGWMEQGLVREGEGMDKNGFLSSGPKAMEHSLSLS